MKIIVCQKGKRNLKTLTTLRTLWAFSLKMNLYNYTAEVFYDKNKYSGGNNPLLGQGKPQADA